MCCMEIIPYWLTRRCRKDVPDDRSRYGIKRLGLVTENSLCCAKPSDRAVGQRFLRLYPGANILVATARKILNRQTENSSVPELRQGIMMRLSSDTASLRKSLFQERQSAMLEDQMDDITPSKKRQVRQGENLPSSSWKRQRKVCWRDEKLNDQTERMMWLPLSNWA